MQLGSLNIYADLNTILDELDSQLEDAPFSNRKESGNNIMICCPYHDDHKPSAGIQKEVGIFHCFTCGETHTLSELISHCFGKEDFGKFGRKWLIRNFVNVEVENRDVRYDVENGKIYMGNESNPIRDNVHGEHNARDNSPTEEELDSYRFYHPYMYKRGMNDEVIDIFDIGYDKNTDCITFPVRDEEGETLFIARRSVKGKFFNYPGGAIKPLYGIYELSQLEKFPEEVYVCESMIDCILLWKHKRYAVALNGVGSKLAYKQLNDLPCRKLVLATDNDEAGMKARKTLRKNIVNKVMYDLIIPEGRKDIGECTDEEIENMEVKFCD